MQGKVKDFFQGFPFCVKIPYEKKKEKKKKDEKMAQPVK